jgi:hypothetical protein
MRITVHEFELPFDDDPMTWIGGAMYQWRQTDKAQWIMANTKPSYHVTPDNRRKRGYKAKITADISDKDLTYYYLKWPK